MKINHSYLAGESSQKLLNEIEQHNIYSDFPISLKEKIWLAIIYMTVRFRRFFTRKKLAVPTTFTKSLSPQTLETVPNKNSFYAINGYLLKKSLEVPVQLLNKIEKDTHVIIKNYGNMGSFPYIHLLNENILELGTHPSLISSLKSIFLTEDISLIRSTIHYKKANDSFYTPWHFDVIENTVTAWIAITESTEENGCLRIVPGSFSINDDRVANYFRTFKSPHLYNLTPLELYEFLRTGIKIKYENTPQRTHRFFDAFYRAYFRHICNTVGRESIVELLKNYSIVNLVMNRKDVLFFSNRLLHSSYPKTTQKGRIAIAYRYTVNNEQCLDKHVELIKTMYNGDVKSYLDGIGLKEGSALRLNDLNSEAPFSLGSIKKSLTKKLPFYQKFHHIY